MLFLLTQLSQTWKVFWLLLCDGLSVYGYYNLYGKTLETPKKFFLSELIA